MDLIFNHYSNNFNFLKPSKQNRIKNQQPLKDSAETWNWPHPHNPLTELPLNRNQTSNSNFFDPSTKPSKNNLQ